MKKTAEEMTAMAEEQGVKLSTERANELAMQELPDEEVEAVSGGHKNFSPDCPKNYVNGTMYPHDYRKTGNTRPGLLWGLNYEIRCIHCGQISWAIFEPDD